jgi:hypothetical protein
MPPAHEDSTPEVENFIARWEKAEASERANYQMFLAELADLLGVPHPDPAGADNEFNSYVFDRAITRQKPDGTSTTVWADLYKRGCFILETKQGANAAAPSSAISPPPSAPAARKAGHGIRGTRQWDISLEKAYNQARGYIRDLPSAEGRPPFLIVCDVGYVIELYSEFTCTGGSYIRFPDPKNHRIQLEDLRDPAIRQRLHSIWTDPLALDPSKHAAKVTREVAEHLSALAKSLEADGHDAQAISTFLQRSLFTMFAEDVGLLPEGCYIEVLQRLKDAPDGFAITITNLWKDMASEEEWSVALMQKIAYFNGGLFEYASALPCNAQQIGLLIGAAKPDWSDVEPAIFGTLLERALSPRERHKLGAHYTPRSYVERLVKPTVIDPLRDRWDAVKTAAVQFTEADQIDKAIAAVKDFHHELCGIKVLDPACGSGNFLYVTLEHMKRLEGEVLELLEALGDDELTFEMEAFKVRPSQFYGLELNGRAVAIAQLVLWIGYFQWHKKTTGTADTKDRPLLPKQQTIVQQDAVLAYDEQTPRKRKVEVASTRLSSSQASCLNPDQENQQDAASTIEEFVCIWDGRTTKTHPVTGKEVPDESVTIPVYDYSNPRRAEWPEADYIVGNPPFIGKGERMRGLLGDGYVEALRKAWKKDVPDSADFVMFWWEKAAQLLRLGKVERFGFITTNSIHQTFNRRILEKHLNDNKKPINIAYAIPDHPWVDTVDGAAVRIAMTVASCDPGLGELNRVTKETEVGDGEQAVELQTQLGKIVANLKIGADLTSANSLNSNSTLCSTGLILGGRGFVIEQEFLNTLFEQNPKTIEISGPRWNGKDIVDNWRGDHILDTYHLTEELLIQEYPEVYQHLRNTVFPERQSNRDEKLRREWWKFRRSNADARSTIEGLDRFLVTPETSKHRFYCFLEKGSKPEHGLVVFGSSDSFFSGIISSVIHEKWALRQGGTLEDRPRYNKTRCFETFPFPDLNEDDPLKTRIRELGEQLDAHRKRQQAAHPKLTLTGMYNVLEKLRKAEPLNDKDKAIHDAGLVTLLKQIHDDLDTAVLEAYGWADLLGRDGSPQPSVLADRLAKRDEALEQELLTRLVALNHERAAEEAKGKVRWLRPEYQDPDYQASGDRSQATEEQQELAGTETPQVSGLKSPPSAKLAWPKDLPSQVAAIRTLIPSTGTDANAIAPYFGKRTKKRISEIDQILTTLKNLGQL